MRSSVTSSMQKTYDECYLICSTAVYYESQNNEAEALRSWRSALDHIYYHHAYRVPPGYRPKSETEKALMDSLREMEKQCKERVDLLEALRRSRLEAAGDHDSSSGGSTIGVKQGSSRSTARSSMEKDQTWLGQGTVPPVTYPELARSKPPPLPQRPTVIVSRKSEADIPKQQAKAQSSTNSGTSNAPPTLPLPSPKKISRSPSPEKRTGLLTTLRNNKDGRTSRSPRASGARKEVRPAASKAATQAWGSLSRSMGDKLGQRTESESITTANSLRQDMERVTLGDNSTGDNKREESRVAKKDDMRAAGSRDIDHRRPPVDSEPVDRRTSEDRSRSQKPPDKPFRSTYAWPKYARAEDNLQAGLKQQSSMAPPPPPPPPSRQTRSRTSPDRSVRSVNKTTRGGIARRPLPNTSSPRIDRGSTQDQRPRGHSSSSEEATISNNPPNMTRQELDRGRGRPKVVIQRATSEDQRNPSPGSLSTTTTREQSPATRARAERIAHVMKNLPRGVDEGAAQQIFNEIVVQGDEVHWDDIAGLEVAKNALKEAVVYPFLRPDLFMGLREPARGMLLFGPPGTGKTMLARAVATESKSTFFSISASSLTSKYLGESEKLVRALFGLAKALAPSIIFVDEIDSLLSSRGGSAGGSGAGEHEATRRIKTEFLIQWSDLARAAAGREVTEKEKASGGDASRVLVLAATNLPWAIDEAARRRFVRRQYIPLPEGCVREKQLRTLMGHQNHNLTEQDFERLVELTDGFSGSDITALAKDAAMGPLRELGEALLHMSPDDIRPIQLRDFEASLNTIRPSVSKKGLQQFEDWAKEFGERGG